jgi:hypothetical protein
VNERQLVTVLLVLISIEIIINERSVTSVR